MTEHTPGPWHWDHSAQQGDRLTDGQSVIVGHGLPVAKSDRAVIAAAPDLLAALKAVMNSALLHFDDMDGQARAALVKAQLAISKAEGKTEAAALRNKPYSPTIEAGLNKARRNLAKRETDD